MKKSKLIISFIFSALLIFSVLTISAFAETEGYYTYTVSNGEATITRFDTSVSGAVTIPDTLGGYPVTAISFSGTTNISQLGFYGCSLLTEITIPESVTSIGRYAFYGCSSLTEITIPESVTSIGSSAFYKCSSLTKITIPEGVTSIVFDAFSYCSSLKEITIPEGVTSISDDAFYGCSSLTNVYFTGDLEDWCNIDFASFSSNPMRYGANLYINGELLTGTVIIPDSITVIKQYTFSGCSSLTEIIIPESVTSIGDYAFYRCSSLTEITIPNGVTSIGDYAFYGCSSLTDVYYTGDLEDWCNIDFDGGYSNPICNGENLYINGELLTGTVIIPDSITEIKDYAFYNCSSLTEITIPGSIISIGTNPFSGCRSLSDVYFTGDLEDWCNIDFKFYDSNPMFYGDNLYINGELLTNAVIPDGIAEIEDYAFYNCSSLTEITIPEGVTSIGNSAFYNCSSITKVTILEGVTSIGSSAFSGCSSLTEITIPESVTSIDSWAFYDCSSLTEIIIPESVTSIGDYAFEDCSLLTDVYYNGDLEDWCNIDFEAYNSNPMSNGANLYINGELLTNAVIPGSITEIKKYTFYGCESLENVTIPEGVTSIDYCAFYDCSSLTEITMPESITFIKQAAFYGCSSLTEITIPEGVTSISDSTFSSCSSLTEIIIPGSVTSIGYGAFCGCKSLAEIIIPKSVDSIEDEAFQECYSLADVYFTGDLEDWCNIDFSGFQSNPMTNGANLYINGELLTDAVIPGSITEITHYTFDGCESLKNVTISEGVTSIGIFAFCGCNSLTEITIPEGVTSIGYYAFCGCNSLTEITIPEGVTSISDSTFSSCSSLTEITIPEGVTSIDSWAFYDCSSLTEITIPEGVTSIGGSAFSFCSSLTDVYYTGSQEEWQNITIGASNGYLTNATIHYNYVIHDHDFENSEWISANDDEHYKQCLYCEKKYIESHNFTNNCDTTCDICEYERAITHDFTKLITSETEHWYICNVCGVEMPDSRAAHTFNNSCDTTCDICEYERAITHDFTKLVTSETEHWYICNVCGVEMPDSRAAHTFNNSCDSTCNSCGYERETEHNFTIIVSDEAQHWYICSECETIDGIADHQDNDADGYCDSCGYYMTEENPDQDSGDDSGSGFLDSIADFFNRIIEFFRSIFSKIFG